MQEHSPKIPLPSYLLQQQYDPNWAPCHMLYVVCCITGYVVCCMLLYCIFTFWIYLVFLSIVFLIHSHFGYAVFYEVFQIYSHFGMHF